MVVVSWSLIVYFSVRVTVFCDPPYSLSTWETQAIRVLCGDKSWISVSRQNSYMMSILEPFLAEHILVLSLSPYGRFSLHCQTGAQCFLKDCQQCKKCFRYNLSDNLGFFCTYKALSGRKRLPAQNNFWYEFHMQCLFWGDFIKYFIFGWSPFGSLCVGGWGECENGHWVVTWFSLMKYF